MKMREFGRRTPPMEKARKGGEQPDPSEADNHFIEKCKGLARSQRNPNGSEEMASLLRELENFDMLRAADSTYGDAKARENLVRPIVDLYHTLTTRRGR